MNKTIDWEIPLSVDDILRGQGMDPETVQRSKPLLRMAADRAYSEGLSLIHPITLTREVKVHEHRHERIILEGGRRLTGPLVTRHLGGSQRVAAVICTIGSELEDHIDDLFGKDPLFALALDGLANAAVEILAQQVCARLGKTIEAERLQASTPLSPGLPEWPVESGQPQIFALLDPSDAGITLTSGGMMHPKKSVSFIVGIGKEMSQTGMCEVCSLKQTCRYGHA